MRVVDIINAADPAKVEAEYRRAYEGEVEQHGQKTWAKAGTFRRYREIVNDQIGVVNEPMTVIIRLMESEDSGGRYYDVSGKQLGDEALYALEFTPWGEWKLMEVEHPADLDLHQTACHLYYEMTWCGWPEQIIQCRDDLLDLKEQVERELNDKE